MFFMPLMVKPLADPNHDPGDRIIIDGMGANIGTISNTKLAEAAVNALNEIERRRVRAHTKGQRP